MHVLEVGFETANRPCALLLHGFPELAYSWRKVMLPLAEAGYHVVAPDHRGYGRTTGWDASYDGDLSPFRITNLVRDTLGLVFALGYRSVAAVVGHDFGASAAAWCALARPDVFRSVVLMSAPFSGPPELPFDTAREGKSAASSGEPNIHEELARLDRPRKHYQWYYSTRGANENMTHCSQGVHDFMRAYYHQKSADWKANKPYALDSWTAGELAKMPTYYIMDRNEGMAETVAHEMPSASEISACQWLTDDELAVYSGEYTRNGFQGGLNWYRSRTGSGNNDDLLMFSGATIDVPSYFIAGTSDWGSYQRAGALEKMQASVCTQMKGVHMLEGAGHWVQQEQPEQVTDLLLGMLE